MVWRTFECMDCDTMFEVEQGMDDDVPDCPNCSKVLEWRPQKFNIGGSIEGKAVNHAQKIMEEDYGLSNFKDNVRPGETGVIMPSTNTAEQEQVTRETKQYVEQVAANPDKMQQFWGQNQGAPTQMGGVTGQGMIAAAKIGPQGHDPMKLLHDGVRQGKIPTTRQMTRIEAAADMKGKRIG